MQTSKWGIIFFIYWSLLFNTSTCIQQCLLSASYFSAMQRILMPTALHLCRFVYFTSVSCLYLSSSYAKRTNSFFRSSENKHERRDICKSIECKWKLEHCCSNMHGSGSSVYYLEIDSTRKWDNGQITLSCRNRIYVLAGRAIGTNYLPPCYKSPSPESRDQKSGH